MQVAVYSQPGCQPCAGVKQLLGMSGVEFTEYDVSTDMDRLDEVISMGYKGVPVVVTDKGHVGGLDIKKIKELVS